MGIYTSGSGGARSVKGREGTKYKVYADCPLLSWSESWRSSRGRVAARHNIQGGRKITFNQVQDKGQVPGAWIKLKFVCETGLYLVVRGYARI